MLRSLLDRLFGRQPAPDPTAPRGAPRARPDAPPPAPPSSPIAVGAHRPMISGRGRIAGFEFRIADAALQRLAGRADATAARAGASSLLAAMRLCAQTGQVAYSEVPARWLGLVDATAFVRGMHLALTGDSPEVEGADPPTDAPGALAAWRSAGAAVGWRIGAVPALLVAQPPDFLLLPREDDPAALLQALRQCREGHPGVPLLATDLPNLEVLEAMLQAGIAYAAARVDGQAESKEARALPPQAQHLLGLMTRLARDADTTEVVAAIKADVGLSYRLLRQLNSAAVSPGVELGSIEQAVALLGRNEIYRWVSALLVRQAPPRPAGQALQTMALARARFFELVAEARGDSPSGALFTMGLASMLPQLLQTRLEDALASLQLHPLAEAALLERTGPWDTYLVLAEVLDEGDLGEAEALARPAGGLSVVMALSARAWLFAGEASAG
jgi:EAL and modified HD-GYP domain-containing signal transduction protein